MAALNKSSLFVSVMIYFPQSLKYECNIKLEKMVVLSAIINYILQDICNKIAELNFTDCHTKIRQVDSQSTVGDGVVVQVTGELSNNGGPMRRFMQTFVLAHQNPKQYYVHNDIFRYQDEVFQEDESEDEGDTDITKPAPNGE